MRGEYDTIARGKYKSTELPPRARRIPDSMCTRLVVRGTTSACAENTFGVVGDVMGHGNYLRVRGEYSGTPGWGSAAEELPPRARRIQGFLPYRLAVDGTTSACAENTQNELGLL